LFSAMSHRARIQGACSGHRPMMPICSGSSG
jgi:hypothetical protein